MKRLLIALFLAVLPACGDSCEPNCNSNTPAGQPGACPDESIPAGEEGGPCHTWTRNCDDGLVCHGSCVPCGNAGQVCCGHNQGEHCTDGSTCEDEPDGFDFCDGACGAANQPCCEGNDCQSGLLCEINTDDCVANPGNADCEGDLTFVIPLIDDFGCVVNSFTLESTDEASALDCAEANITGYELGPVNQLPEESKWCLESFLEVPQTVTVHAFSDAAAETCAQAQCTNCTLTPGECTEEP